MFLNTDLFGLFPVLSHKCRSNHFMKFCCFALLLLFNFSVSANNNNTPLKYDLGVGGGWIPYQRGADPKQIGIFEEITQFVQQHSNIVFETVNYPPKRAEFALKNETVDFDFICVEWFADNQFDDSTYVVSDPIFSVTEYYVTLDGNAKKFETRRDAFGKNVGTIAGYFYHDDVNFKRMDFLNEGQLILGLQHNRFKTAILEQETAKYWARTLNVRIEFAARHSVGQLRFRLLKKHKALIPKINQTINKMKLNGELANIFKKHNIEAEIVPPTAQKNR